MLDSGAFRIDEPNWSDERNTPLAIACEFGWLDTAKVLIARGANVNYVNAHGKTPLILATELIAPYDLEMCKMLVQNGARLNDITLNKNEYRTKQKRKIISDNHIILLTQQKIFTFNPHPFT